MPALLEVPSISDKYVGYSITIPFSGSLPEFMSFLGHFHIFFILSARLLLLCLVTSWS